MPARQSLTGTGRPAGRPLRTALCALFVWLQAGSALAGWAHERPRLALLLSAQSAERQPTLVHGSAFAWTGIATLAGVPYDTLLLEEFLAQPDPERYDALVLIQCVVLDDAVVLRLAEVLAGHLARGRHLIVDGPLALRDRDGALRDTRALDDLLRLKRGFGGAGASISALEPEHFIRRPFRPGEPLARRLRDGFRTLEFRAAGQVVLAASDGSASHAFLSTLELGASRLVLISDLSYGSYIPSIFRNASSPSFFPGRIYPALVRALHWTLYGDTALPFPAPQLSHAAMTAFVRLDADQSRSLEAQRRTTAYLAELARETGALPVYGWVSSGAAQAGWDALAAFGAQLEALGGEMATHTRNHSVDRALPESVAREELDGSVRDIETALAERGRSLGPIDILVNPNSLIPLVYYPVIARRFSVLLTHGFEEELPLGYGNFTWFTGGNRDFVAITSSPVGDYQWFYDPTWSYTTEQAAGHQHAILDHLFHAVGRGVLFDPMWHDYGLVSEPLDFSNASALRSLLGLARVQNADNRALYDRVSRFFAEHDIYFPRPHELAQKLRAMAQWDYSWSATPEQVELELDLSRTPSRDLGRAIGSMGIRIENTDAPIRAVWIDGLPHDAFSEHVVILPDLPSPQTSIRVELGPPPAERPRLVYVSKRLEWIRRTPEGLELRLATRSKARFAFEVGAPYVLEGADAWQWDRETGVLSGHVISDRTLRLVRPGT